jgi:Met-zincin
MHTSNFKKMNLINSKGLTMGKQLKVNSVLLVALAAMALASCTKPIPYDEMEPGKKEHNVSKAMVDTNAEYLYSASMQNASRSSSDALPFSTGDNKRVKLEMTEKSLRIIEAEKDERYAANKTNNKLLLEVPVEHVQFQCAKDKYGECTNKEEEAAKIPWEQRDQIRVKLEEAKSGELDLLPIMISQTEGQNCYETVSTRLMSSVITADAINFQVERTFKTKIECLGNVDTLTDAVVSAVFHYSLVKVDSILSKNYKPVSYPEGSEDEQSFGFFTSHKTVLDIDNNKTENSTVQMMNRWNPERNEITYYLSDEFAKPENKQIKDLTYKTVENLNKGLEISGVKFRISLKDPAGKVPGDIRNSMIVLVEDPVESNIIGYGPQTEDPVTGEIISARTVMFLGTIKKFIKSTYDEILDEKRAAKTLNKAKKLSLSKNLSTMVASMKQTTNTAGAAALVAKVANFKKQPATTNKIIPVSPGRVTLNVAKQSLQKYTKNVNPAVVGLDLASRMKYQLRSKNCAFEPTAESFSGGISEKLMAQIPDDAKPWVELSESEKNRIIEIILPEIWVPTLIHEMGHNLGLRHNFKASEDKENFYSKEELQQNNMDHAVPFSSVMDYGNDLKTLSVLGKYDIAALRFGYLRQIDVQEVQEDAATGEAKVLSTKTVAVSTTLDELLPALEKEKQKTRVKPYGYCTDEHTGINAGCKRFDLGTSLTEITSNLIKDYESAYKKRNFRNGRASMSLMDDLSYAARVKSTFLELRIMMESAERIKNMVGEDSKLWEQIPWLKDLKQASLNSGAFLTKVLLVPDTMCALALKTTPNEVAGVLNLVKSDPNALSCWELEPARMGLEKYVVVAQAGKFLNSKKSSKSRNNFADQIDIRGIWPDKIAATNMLLNRRVGIFTMDKEIDNFLNVGELREDIKKIFSAVMMNNVVDTVSFELADHSVVDLEINYDLFDTQVIDRPLMLDALEARGLPSQVLATVAKRFGVKPDGTTQLQEILSTRIKSDLRDDSGKHEKDRAVIAEYDVDRLNANFTNTLSPDALVADIEDTKFVAGPRNLIARQAITSRSLSMSLASLEKDKILEIYQAKVKKVAMPEGTPEAEKVAWDKSVEELESVLNGSIKEPSFYNRLLNIL